MANKTTRELLLEQLDASENGLAELYEKLDGVADELDEDSEDEARDELDNYALSVDKQIVVHVNLTLGGPNVWVECDVTPSDYGGYTLDNATLKGAWGSDRTQRGVHEDSALWRFCAEQIELLAE